VKWSEKKKNQQKVEHDKLTQSLDLLRLNVGMCLAESDECLIKGAGRYKQ
jgi:hypothetical protein